MERNRISFQIESDQRKQIETRIKAEYPKPKNVFDVVIAALDQFSQTDVFRGPTWLMILRRPEFAASQGQTQRWICKEC